jgi:hypothetical protein
VIRLAVGDEEPVLAQQVGGLAVFGGESNDSGPSMRSRRAATSGETSSCASVNVFIRNTSSRFGRGTRTLKTEGCILSNYSD